MTELRERAQKQKAELERRMMGGGSDDEDDDNEVDGEGEGNKSNSKVLEDSGCSWGMGERLCCSLLDVTHMCPRFLLILYLSPSPPLPFVSVDPPCS